MLRSELIDKIIEHPDFRDVIVGFLDIAEPLIRTNEREEIAAGIWKQTMPIVDWIAGINTERLTRENDND